MGVVIHRYVSLYGYHDNIVLYCRNHLNLLEKTNQLILELKHLDLLNAQRYIYYGMHEFTRMCMSLLGCA